MRSFIVIGMWNQLICEVSWEVLKVGDRVVSATGICGVIIELVEDSSRLVADDRRNQIRFQWDGKKPNKVLFPHLWLSKVEYVG